MHRWTVLLVLLTFLAACETPWVREPAFTPLGGTLTADDDLAGRLKREWRVRQTGYELPNPLQQSPNLRQEEGPVYAATVYNLLGSETAEVHIAYWIEARDVFYVQLRADDRREGLVNRWFGPFPLEYTVAPENETPAGEPAGAGLNP